MRLRQGFERLFLVVVGIATIVACTPPPTAPALTPMPKWLRWSGVPAELCASPQLKRHPFLPVHGCLTHGGLARAAYVSGKIAAVPVGAESFEATGPTQWRIRLKENFRWSDGEPVRAEEVVESWRQVLARCGEFPRALETFGNVVEARRYCNRRKNFSSVGIRAVDARTIVVQTALPQPRFPLGLASPAAWPFRGDKGTGPFRFSLDPASKILRFTANPFFSGAKAPLNGIELTQPGETPTHRILSFLAGESDAVDNVPESLMATLGADPRLKTFAEPRAWFLVLGGGPEEVLQRRALQKAVDPDSAVRLLRWPNLPVTRLTAAAPGWIAAPTPAPVGEISSAPALRTVSVREKNAATEALAGYVTAQWTRNFGSPPLGVPSAAAWLVERELNPLRPEADLKSWLGFLSLGERAGRAKNRLYELSLIAAESAAEEVSRDRILEGIEKELVGDQALVLPLFSAVRTALVSPRITGLARDPLGNWDFAQVDLEVAESERPVRVAGP